MGRRRTGSPIVQIIECIQELLTTGEYHDRTGLVHEHEVKITSRQTLQQTKGMLSLKTTAKRP